MSVGGEFVDGSSRAARGRTWRVKRTPFGRCPSGEASWGRHGGPSRAAPPVRRILAERSVMLAPAEETGPPMVKAGLLLDTVADFDGHEGVESPDG